MRLIALILNLLKPIERPVDGKIKKIRNIKKFNRAFKATILIAEFRIEGSKTVIYIAQ